MSRWGEEASIYVLWFWFFETVGKETKEVMQGAHIFSSIMLLFPRKASQMAAKMSPDALQSASLW